MSEAGNRTPEARKKRVRRLKKIIILVLMLSIAIPWVACGVLFIKVNKINQTLEEMSERLEKLADMQQVQAEQSVLKEETVPAAENPSDEEDEAEGTEPVPEEEEISGRKVYLTFDDGPSIYTEEILNILEQYDVKATFFVVGKEDEASKVALQKIVDGGHTLGMHSYSHKYRELYESLDSFTEDFQMLRNYLYDVTGQTSMFYRFPGGSSNTVSKIDMQEFAGYLTDEGVTFFDWNISSGDGGSVVLPVETLVENCTKNVEQWNNAVILMHDSAEKPTMVEALPAIIETIQAMEDTEILPITEDTVPIQHIHMNTKVKE